jgi:two-component system response regulator FixJ
MCRVFLIDDDQDLKDTLLLVLRNEGHTVYDYNDPEAAIADIDNFKPTTIILDLMTPKGESDEYVSYFVNQGCVVIVYTGNLDDERHVELLKRGATWVFNKPIPIGALTEYVRKADRVAGSLKIIRRMGRPAKALREELRSSTEALAKLNWRISVESAASAVS